MTNYEMVIILKPELEEEKRSAALDRIYDAINENGKVGEVDEWGIRKLAYEINYIKEGYYVIVNFEADPTVVAEAERRARIQDQIIRYMVIKKES